MTIGELWQKVNIFRRGSSCHETSQTASNLSKIAIVGNPNVGKSVVFTRLTGSRTVISNYPGTTVDIMRGKANLGGKQVEIVDTPGMYSFLPITEEERVAREILIKETPGVILHVVDTKNLERMIPLTLQLIEAELPVVLQLNMMDEAESAGIEIDAKKLEQELGVPVVATVAVTGHGMDTLRQALATFKQPPGQPPLQHGADIETALEEITGLLKGSYSISKRSVGLLLLERDEEIARQVREKEGSNYEPIQAVVSEINIRYSQPVNYVVTLKYRQKTRDIIDTIVTSSEKTGQRFTERLSRTMMHPLSGGIIFLFVIFIGLYLFVGVFGAGILVDLIEGTVFGEWINPWLTDL
jgi:ferrous iron transport protein B